MRLARFPSSRKYASKIRLGRVFRQNSDIYHSHPQVENLKKRGMEFLNIPDEYYAQLRKRLAKSKVKVVESVDELQKLKILIDYDDNGYLLQAR